MSLSDRLFGRTAAPVLMKIHGDSCSVDIAEYFDTEPVITGAMAILGQTRTEEEPGVDGTIEKLSTREISLLSVSCNHDWHGWAEDNTRGWILVQDTVYSINRVISLSDTLIRLEVIDYSELERARPSFRRDGT